MAKSIHHSDEELLVAYLDGELPPEVCRQIEARLARDDQFRQQMQSLDDAWHALDELPTSTAGESFTKTTMEMVTVAAEEDHRSATTTLPIRRRRKRWWLALVGLAAATVGVAANRIMVPNQNMTLVADLPVIMHADIYSQFRDVEFLRNLRSAVGANQLRESTPQLDESVAQWDEVTRAAVDQRQQVIAALPHNTRAELAARAQDFFHNTSEDSKAEMRRLHQAIATATDSAELQETLLAYRHWLSQRKPGVQAELRALPAEERLARIQQVAHEEQQQAWKELSDEDAATLRRIVMRVLRDAHRNQAGGPGDDRKRRIHAELTARRMLRDPQTRLQFMDDIRTHLSAEAKRHLMSLGGRRPEQLQRWIADAMGTNATPRDLADVFTDVLSNDERAALLALPREQMEHMLRERYLREKIGMRDAGQHWDQLLNPRRGPRRPPPATREERRPEQRRRPI